LFSKSNGINKQATNGQKHDLRPSKYMQFLCTHNCQFDSVNSPGGSTSVR